MSTSNTVQRSSSHFFYIRQALRLRIPLALATMVFAALGLIANFIDVDVLFRPLEDRAATHPITALCLFGLGFGAFRMKRFGETPVSQVLIIALIMMICMARVMEATITAWTGAPSLAMFGPIGPFHGRFSIEAAVALGIFASAALMRQGHGRFGLVFLMGGLAVVYNIGLELSYGMTFFNGDVGAFTFLGMICVSLVMVTVYIHRPFVRVSFLVGDIGSQTRIMAFATVMIPWSCGYLLHAI